MEEVGHEMFFSDAEDGESPDLGLWKELLDERDIAEIVAIREKR